MTRLQRAAILLLCLAGAVATCGVQTCRLRHSQQRAESAEAAEAMTAAGWTAAEERRRLQVPAPLPPGARPVAVVVGSVGYGARRTLSPGSGGSIPPTTIPNPGPGGEIVGQLESVTVPAAPPTVPGVWPTPEDLAGGCTTTIVEAGGTWWAKTLWTGRLRLPDGGELVRPDVELELQRVEVARALVAPPPRRLALGVRRPAAWRAGWVAGVGVSYDPVRATAQPAAFVGYALQF